MINYINIFTYINSINMSQKKITLKKKLEEKEANSSSIEESDSESNSSSSEEYDSESTSSSSEESDREQYEKDNVKERGQYFTTETTLQKKVYQFIKNKPSKILEPSVGRGDIVKYINKLNKKVKFDCYEIDKNIKFIIESKNIKIQDFLKSQITNKYKTIIGNPPYVKTKTGNLYLDFIWKCFCLLCEKGELIFIIPSDFFKLTSSKKIIKEMLKEGTFTDIYHPHDETLFKNASIDVLIFRYCKNKNLPKIVLYNDEKMHIIENDGIVTFRKNIGKDTVSIDKYFDIYVGLVSGKESVFKNCNLNNIEILNNQNQIDKYIYITNYPSENEDINKYLLENKDVLIKRKIKKFNESNWYQWGAPRNIRVMEEKKGTECIYVKNLTRNDTVAFSGKVMYFGGALLIMIPKKKVNTENVIDYLNSEQFKENYIYSGRFKIGHKQLSKAYIPREIL